MVDRVNRNKLAESCRHYSSCLIDNFEFDKINFELESEDRAVTEITRNLWFLYDDIRNHRNSGKFKMDDAQEKLLKRIILFLKSDMEYRWFHPSMLSVIKKQLKKIFRINAEIQLEDELIKGDIEFWPFCSKEGFDLALLEPKYLSKNGAGTSSSIR